MTKNVLDYLCKCNGWLVAMNNVHWSAVSMSQHKLCDEIFDLVKSFDDTVAEIEQGATSNIEPNQLKADDYTVKDLDSFLNDIYNDTLSFYKNLDGDKYIGLRSECESFLGNVQKYIYLNRFCEKHGEKAHEENKDNNDSSNENENNDVNESRNYFKEFISESVRNYLKNNYKVK